MSRKQFRIKDTRFSVIERRDGSAVLYRANADGNPSWWFLGIFASEGGRNGWRPAARKNAATRPIKPVREGEPAPDPRSPEERFSGALERAQVRRFSDA